MGTSIFHFEVPRNEEEGRLVDMCLTELSSLFTVPVLAPGLVHSSAELCTLELPNHPRRL
jgi:hypothetical protein